ncbi:copper amine oxidase N-terminal domain-containing protein [Paenibacillus thermotolerans]|uniref:copper amine oxidase N-terminal domain-containing protein n=1 Tax=Paenibacillus thermotolerans TaxID=3027807 RepID=UPI002367AA7C|nr:MULTISPECIES: copper amine oxidase N-terminal domain-containing protein [unclassified Paenibacillus]
MKMQKAILLIASILLASYEVPSAFAETSQIESGSQTDQSSAKTILYLNSNRIQSNGAAHTLSGTTVVRQGVTYVSLRSLAGFLGYTVTYDAVAKEISAASNNTVARYRVHTKTYEVNESQQMMRGEAYVDKGVLMVPITSLTAAFRIPYTLDGDRITLSPGGLGSGTVTEEPQNEPPKAYFRTDKDQYRIGETVTIYDESTDDENAITGREWGNNEPVFFEAGLVEIKLTVKDKHGLTSTYSKQIEITSDVMYSKEEYGMRIAPPGSSIDINDMVLSYASLPYTYATEPYVLFRTSGPESVNEEGILYRDTISGPTRLMIHHKNSLNTKARFYLIATNRNDTAVSIQYENAGFAGPSPFPELTGRMAGARYLQSTLTGNELPSGQIAPGESVALFPQLNAAVAAPGDVVSLNADLTSDGPIEYTMLMVRADQDPIAALPFLPDLNPFESIVRGTFADSTRVFTYDGIVGQKPERLPLTDNTSDPFQEGMDGILNSVAINSGNYGVLYKITLNRVSPGTLIAFNPRGGRYFGSARVNRQVVDIKSSGSQQSATVLYRTKDQEEKVEIWLSPASGSNLPFTLLFLPISEE